MIDTEIPDTPNRIRLDLEAIYSRLEAYCLSLEERGLYLHVETELVLDSLSIICEEVRRLP